MANYRMRKCLTCLNKLRRWFLTFALFPLICVSLAAVGVTVSYAIAVELGHVDPLPNVSDISEGGNRPPASYFFTLVCTWTSLLGFITVASFYRYVIQRDKQSLCNKLALAFGFMFFSALTVVGAVQVESARTAHVVAAVTAFMALNFYLWAVIYISWHQLVKNDNSKWMAVARCFIGFLKLISIVTFSGLVAKIMEGDNPMTFTSVFEWSVALFGFLFLASLAYELRNVVSATIVLQFKGGEAPLTDPDTAPNTNA